MKQYLNYVILIIDTEILWKWEHYDYIVDTARGSFFCAIGAHISFSQILPVRFPKDFLPAHYSNVHLVLSI